MVYVNLDRLLILSIGFFLLFSAFGTAQSLAATVLSENGLNNLGFYSLSLLYLSFGICSLFSSIVVHRLGTRYSMILGSMCYSCYIGSFILAA
jgi:ABC-type enterochelin transport system permease subunit